MIVRQNHEFRLNYFLAAIVGVSCIAWFFNTVPPKEGSVVGIGIVLISLTTYCFLASVIKNVRRCVLWSSGVGVFLLLRASNLHNGMYIVLLIAVIVSLEYAFRTK